MSVIKISNLPDAPYKELMSEAYRRGLDLTKEASQDGTLIVLIGALDLIRELRGQLDEHIKNYQASREQL